jgi:hypothetical protein
MAARRLAKTEAAVAPQLADGFRRNPQADRHGRVVEQVGLGL